MTNATKTKTETSNFTDLMHWLGREITAEQASIAEFANKLATEPAHALGWHGSRAIDHAANLYVCKEVLLAMEAATDIRAAANSLLREATRTVFETARGAVTYSDPMQREMKAKIAARWSRMIDPQCRDSLGDTLQAIANGCL